jgi:hypothetical protein
MMARFYYNTQRDLQQPLLFKRKSERLLLGKVQGIVHTLMPSSVNEVLQQLDAQLVEEVVGALWQKVDTEQCCCCCCLCPGMHAGHVVSRQVCLFGDTRSDATELGSGLSMSK